MDDLEFKILSKRQDLRDLLLCELKQVVVSLRKVNTLKAQISMCDSFLDILTSTKQLSKTG